MPKKIETLYLASQSPRRHNILQEMGVTFTPIKNLLENEYLDHQHGSIRNQLKHLCLNKATASGKHINGWVLTADTIIYYNNQVIGKPSSYKEAITILTKLSNTSHRVITACCLLNTKTQKHYFCSDVAIVKFNVLKQSDILKYINEKQPFDKAGSYGIQDIPTHFLHSKKGQFSTILGLPKQKVRILLKHIYT